ncbi:MAG: hypothetical protein D6734_08835 [Candidatus Schekmanbacteria bacterium]|nr:MAG: hypothetical protein D6734_08835 [Candidatus Schekmanbacteria bacterium]
MMKKPFVFLFMLFMTLTLIACSQSKKTPQSKPYKPAENFTFENEFPVKRIPNFPRAAESYFSPDGKSIICQAKMDDDTAYHAYTATIDGKNIRRINDKGEDACNFYFPSGDKIVWTSTRDHLDMPKGDWSDSTQYPQGAELYISDLEGKNIKRITNNKYYDAEVSVSPDGKWILFGRQINGNMDLWRMKSDGTEEFQITHTPDWQEGGAFYMPDSETIIYRAWKKEYDGQRRKPMTIFTIKHDGTGLKQITHDDGTNWAPYPHPDGKHFAFVKVLPPSDPAIPMPNFEIFMMNLETGKQTRLTYFDGFDGFPSISPDGKTLMFSSSRATPPGERALQLFLMDISNFKD